MKTIKVNHVVLTLALSSAALATGGETQQSIDEKVNKRLAEGYDEVEVFPLRTNTDERQQASHAVNLYVFRKFEDVVKPKKDA
jgi:hypothetical protein